jgi:hypothetical protein
MAQQSVEAAAEKSPVAWFCVLAMARKNSDFELAAQATRKLQELGIIVKFKPRHTAPPAVEAVTHTA